MAEEVQVYDRDGATPLSGLTLARIVAGTSDVGRKLWVKNTGDRALGAGAGHEPFLLGILQVEGNDGWERMRIKADDGDSISPPWGLEATLLSSPASGVWASGGLKGYVVVAMNATGKTVASDEATVLIGNLTDDVAHLEWQDVPGATQYEIHRTDTPGDYSAATLLDTVAGSVNDYDDEGTATGVGVPPVENTTGGSAPDYGTAPSGLLTATASFQIGSVPGTLEVGEWYPFWIARVVPSNSTPAGNDRAAYLRFSEVG